ncbi:MAG: N-acetylneuraminate synthase family protein [Eubacterium sp.]|nr:N-acetylneuraminate synthase family protein [Eubacterium sp.]
MGTFITAEIGINHNGDLDLAKKLIDMAVTAGCDAVKFRKRTIEKNYTKEYLDEVEESPWGHTRRARVEALEFRKEEYDAIDAYCEKKGILWYASAYDTQAEAFLQQYHLKYKKIASAMLTNTELLEMVAQEGQYTFIATGMSTYEEIGHAVEIFRKYNCPFELMHCISTYPMVSMDANLRMIHTLSERYGCKVGYSGHEIGTLVSTCAVAMGATSVERHITLNKTMYGFEQKASVDPVELWQLVKNIRETEMIMGTGEKILSEAEQALREKCRR